MGEFVDDLGLEKHFLKAISYEVAEDEEEGELDLAEE